MRVYWKKAPAFPDTKQMKSLMKSTATWFERASRGRHRVSSAVTPWMSVAGGSANCGDLYGSLRRAVGAARVPGLQREGLQPLHDRDAPVRLELLRREAGPRHLDPRQDDVPGRAHPRAGPQPRPRPRELADLQDGEAAHHPGHQVRGPGVRRPVGRHGHQQPPVLRRRAAAARLGRQGRHRDEAGHVEAGGRRGVRLGDPGRPGEGLESRVVLGRVPHDRRREREAAGQLRGEGHAGSPDPPGHGAEVAADPGRGARQPAPLAVLPGPRPRERHAARGQQLHHTARGTHHLAVAGRGRGDRPGPAQQEGHGPGRTVDHVRTSARRARTT